MLCRMPEANPKSYEFENYFGIEASGSARRSFQVTAHRQLRVSRGHDDRIF
jgi:hypothetical protein